jgi:uncharacterized surface protein with fasciclin (FAS1) repeats
MLLRTDDRRRRFLGGFLPLLHLCIVATNTIEYGNTTNFHTASAAAASLSSQLDDLYTYIHHQRGLTNISSICDLSSRCHSILNDTDTLTTVFAPVDSAIARLPLAIRTALWDPANNKGRDEFLTYHFAFGDILSTALKPAQDIQTREGRTVHVTRSSSDVIRVENATVLTKDLECINGVIQTIDGPLSPPVPTPTPPPPTPKPKQPTPGAPTPTPTPAPGPSAKCELLPGINIPPPDLAFIPSINGTTCCILCKAIAGCKAFSTNASGCALKQSTGSMKPFAGSSSGVNTGMLAVSFTRCVSRLHSMPLGPSSHIHSHHLHSHHLHSHHLHSHHLHSHVT